MAYHPLLDWRLGLDMARLALDPGAQIDFGVSHWAQLLIQTATPYFEALNLNQQLFGGLPAGIDTFNNEAIILIHPLWDTEQSNYRPDVAAAVADAHSRGLTATLRSIFHAVRFPYE